MKRIVIEFVLFALIIVGLAWWLVRHHGSMSPEEAWQTVIFVQ